MKQSDITLLMKGMAPVIGQFIEKAMLPFVERIAELEQQISDMPAPKDGRNGVDGKDGANGADGMDGAPGRDGKDAAPITPEMIAEAVAQYLLANPPAAGRDGRDGIDGAPGQDGKNAEPVTTEQLAEAVAGYLAENPPAAGKDGRDGVDGKDGAPGVDGSDGAPGTDGKDGVDGRNGVDGKDGVGLADAIIDRSGALVLTMTDGRTKELGIVIGKDGTDGAPGNDGAPGCDGFGFHDLDLVDDEQGVVLRFIQGDAVKNFPLPVVVDRGVFKEDGEYRKGNGVTWGGSYWIAQKDDPGKPDTPDSGWRLAVKKGQNGKDLTR